MARPGRFLLLTWDGGGNVPPMLGLARRLAARGHRVRVLAPPALLPRIAETGAEGRPFVDAPALDPAIAAEDRIRDYFAYWNGGALARELDRELSRAPADALALDCMLLGAMAAAERAGVPWASLVHFLYAPSVSGRWGRGWEAVRGDVNAFRVASGLGPLAPGRSLLDQAWERAARVLVASVPEFDAPLERTAANVRYVGPLRHDGQERWTWDLPWAEDDPRPLVCVSLSTTYQHQEEVLQRIVDAVAGVDARLLVTTGGAVLPGDGPRLPAGAVARAWVPHAAVLPRAALMVTHAGHGTALSALAHGVPLLCLPMGRDQHLVAERVAACGAGVVVSRDAPVDEVRAAVRGVLAGAGYRERARWLAGRIAPLAGGDDAVLAMEGLLPLP